MNFADKLKKAAKDSGHKTVQGEIPGGKSATPVEKAKPVSAASFADKLKSTVAANKGEINTLETDFNTGLVAKWSFSGLKSHENCQWYTQLNKVDRIPQESGPQAARGSEIHDACELWVRGERSTLPTDSKTRFDVFQDDFVGLKHDFQRGLATLEDKWGVRKDWSPCDWDDEEIWGRGALDAFVIEVSGLKDDEKVHFVDGELMLSLPDGEFNFQTYLDEHPDVADRLDVSCRIIDYKTGRKFGNEMKHADQGLCYALHATHRFPMINTFQVEFWYIDQGQKMVRAFNRKQLSLLLVRYHNRAKAMTTAIAFKPSANVHTCRFCSYGSNKAKDGRAYGNGACAYDAYRGADDD